MHALIIFSVAVATASAATFFESPHNERAAPFYKVPVNHDFSSSLYRPAPAPYKPQESFYRPEQPIYKPQAPLYNPEPAFYKPQSPYKSSYGGDYGHGASSFQTVRLGGDEAYKPQYNPYF